MPPATATATPPLPNATNSAQALQNLQDYNRSAVTPGQAMDTAYGKYGVNDAQQQVKGLRGAINSTNQLLSSVAPSVMGRTSGSLVTTAQAGRQIQNEQAPIADNLNKQQNDYANANADYQDVLGKASTDANATITGQQNQMSYLQNIYSNLSAKEQAEAAARAQAEQQAEAKRQFDAQMAESRRQFSATQGGLSGLSSRINSLLGGGNSSASSPAPAAPAQFAKGTVPSKIVNSLFQGYRPGQDKYFTENVVIPALRNLMTLNNPKQSKDVINAAADNLAYNARHALFGE